MYELKKLYARGIINVETTSVAGNGEMLKEDQIASIMSQKIKFWQQSASCVRTLHYVIQGHTVYGLLSLFPIQLACHSL